MANAIQVINPYRWEGLWVFDDPRTELVREPFIEGSDASIYRVLAEKGIGNLENRLPPSLEGGRVLPV